MVKTISPWKSPFFVCVEFKQKNTETLRELKAVSTCCLYAESFCHYIFLYSTWKYMREHKSVETQSKVVSFCLLVFFLKPKAHIKWKDIYKFQTRSYIKIYIFYDNQFSLTYICLIEKNEGKKKQEVDGNFYDNLEET